MSQEGFRMEPIRGKESMAFTCQRCGECCRRARKNVMLESLDAYRIVQFLNKRDKRSLSVADVYYQFTEMTPLSEGFPIYTLKAMGEKEECIFLKDGACSIYEARPRTCRLYPITAAPGSRGKDFDYFLCYDKEHHFGKGRLLFKDWLYQNFKQDEREFVKREFVIAAEIGPLWNKLDSGRRERILFLLVFFRYHNYDCQQPFFEQYVKNHEAIKHELQRMAEEAERKIL